MYIFEPWLIHQVSHLESGLYMLLIINSHQLVFFPSSSSHRKGSTVMPSE